MKYGIIFYVWRGAFEGSSYDTPAFNENHGECHQGSSFWPYLPDLCYHCDCLLSLILPVLSVAPANLFDLSYAFHKSFMNAGTVFSRSWQAPPSHFFLPNFLNSKTHFSHILKFLKSLCISFHGIKNWFRSYTVWLKCEENLHVGSTRHGSVNKASNKGNSKSISNSTIKNVTFDTV